MSASIVSIDPGISGAAVRLVGGVLTACRDFKERIHIVEAIKSLLRPGDHVVIEAVHAMPGEGVCSVFSFGKSTGTALGTIETITGRSPVEVPPQRWQNYFRRRLSLPKAPFKTMTREVAIKLFPRQVDLFARKKDHGTSDAALLAVYHLSTL
jgi:hypothetical protein